jgi:hypothetical protein
MEWLRFEAGFWHPFGTHAGEGREQIVKRKRSEIELTGWTLWSFQFRKSVTVWQEVLAKLEASRVWALCSDSRRARDPSGRPTPCTFYRLSATSPWCDVPPTIAIPHPMSHGRVACAFVVKAVQIIEPASREPPMCVSWYSTQTGTWRNDSLPTRGEYLIRHGGRSCLRPVYTVLELKEPYVVEIAALPSCSEGV